MGGTARIETKSSVRQGFADTGTIGNGGVIAINSNGPVDIGRQVVLDSSGKVAGTIDNTLINIEGSVVNIEGTLMANGVESRGGTIRVISTGQTDLYQVRDVVQSATNAGTFTTTEAAAINNRLLSLKTTAEGNINIASAGTGGKPALLQTQGAGGGYAGGTIILTAQNNLNNGGWLLANGGSGDPVPADTSNPGSFTNGGSGGTVSLNAGQNITNTGRITADGGGGGLSIDLGTGRNGGDAGLVSFAYGNQMVNNGVIRAIGGGGAFAPNNGGNGGNGGLVVFSGPSNLSGSGSVYTYGGGPGGNFEGGGPGNFGRLGTIVAPDPATSTNKLYGIWQKTQPIELLTHAENLLLLTKDSSTTVPVNLFDQLLAARIRSVQDPTGLLGLARSEVISKNSQSSPYIYRNLIISSSRENRALDMTHPYTDGPPELRLPSPLSQDLAFTGLNSVTVLNNGPVTTAYVSPFPSDEPARQFDFWILGRNHPIMGGGRFSILANGDVLNRNTIGTRGTISGGSINIASSGVFINGLSESNIILSSPIHGGSLRIKARGDIINNPNTLYQVSAIHADGGLIGGTINFQSGNDFKNLPIPMSVGRSINPITANGGAQGGIITIRTRKNFLNELSTTSTIALIQANGTSPGVGRGGFIRVISGKNAFNYGRIEVNGTLENGSALFSPNIGSDI